LVEQPVVAQRPDVDNGRSGGIHDQADGIVENALKRAARRRQLRKGGNVADRERRRADSGVVGRSSVSLPASTRADGPDRGPTACS
jgi:hypothetical protein